MYKEDKEKIKQMLEEQNYVSDSAIVMSVYLAKHCKNLCSLKVRPALGKQKLRK